MNIKNYTSQVPANVTVARIEDLIVGMGACNISKIYDGGKLAGIMFVAPDPATKQWHEFRVPVNPKAVATILSRKRHKKTAETEAADYAQGERTAWRLMQEWIGVQLSLVQMQQAELLQVFMPYVWNGEKTLFESIRATAFKALPGPESAIDSEEVKP